MIMIFIKRCGIFMYTFVMRSFFYLLRFIKRWFIYMYPFAVWSYFYYPDYLLIFVMLLYTVVVLRISHFYWQYFKAILDDNCNGNNNNYLWTNMGDFYNRKIDEHIVNELVEKSIAKDITEIWIKNLPAVNVLLN